MTFATNSFNRLTADGVEHLEWLLGGDPKTEQAILDYIKLKWGCPNLSYLTPKQAEAVVARTEQFMAAVWKLQNQPF